MKFLTLLIAGCFLTAPALAQDAGPSPVAAEKVAAVTADKKPSKKGVFSAPYIGETKLYKTKYEDTLVKLARDNDLGFVELRSANPDVDPWLPGANVEMVLPARHLIPDAPRHGIVINLPEMRLYRYPDDGSAPDSYPIGIGREGLQTPVGHTQIVSKIDGPTWRPTKRMLEQDPTLDEVVPPGPDNPLGTHALYLGWPEYRIHGTNKPYGIGRRSSSGCIRLYPEDIVKLFPVVPVGTGVTVVNQPVKAAWIDDVFYIEVHPTMEQADRMEVEGGMPTFEMTQDDMKSIMKAVGSDAAPLLDWSRIRQVVRERRGYPIAVLRRPVVAQEKKEDLDHKSEDAAPVLKDGESKPAEPS
jgi:L,D-transpeptidase ErfK/SrfK